MHTCLKVIGVFSRIFPLSNHGAVQFLKTLLAAVIGCAGDPDIEDLAKPFMEGVCRHFALLYAAGGGHFDFKKSTNKDKDERSARDNHLKFLDPHVFLEALMTVSSWGVS